MILNSLYIYLTCHQEGTPTIPRGAIACIKTMAEDIKKLIDKYWKSLRQAAGQEKSIITKLRQCHAET